MYTVWIRRTPRSAEECLLSGIPSYDLADRLCKNLGRILGSKVATARIEKD